MQIAVDRYEEQGQQRGKAPEFPVRAPGIRRRPDRPSGQARSLTERPGKTAEGPGGNRQGNVRQVVPASGDQRPETALPCLTDKTLARQEDGRNAH